MVPRVGDGDPSFPVHPINTQEHHLSYVKDFKASLNLSFELGVAQVSNGDDGWADVLSEECDRNNALPSTGDHVETEVEWICNIYIYIYI